MRRCSILGLGLVFALSLTASAEVMIDDFSTQFGAAGGGALHSLEVFGAQPFDEWTDAAPAGAIGSRHEWLEGWDFEYPTVVNDLYVMDLGDPYGSLLIFGGFDNNLQFGLDYGTEAPLNLDLSTESAFLLDWTFSDIPTSPPLTITVETGTGTGSMTIETPLWDDLENPLLLEFPFDMFSGTPDWADVDVIRLLFVTVNEFGPDVAFDDFRTLEGPTPTESTTWGEIKANFQDRDVQ